MWYENNFWCVRFFHVKYFFMIWTTDFCRKLWNWKARKKLRKIFFEKKKWLHGARVDVGRIIFILPLQRSSFQIHSSNSNFYLRASFATFFFFFEKFFCNFFSRFSISKLLQKSVVHIMNIYFTWKKLNIQVIERTKNYFHITSTASSNFNQSKIIWFFHDFSHFKLQSAPTQDKFLDFLQNQFSLLKFSKKIFWCFLRIFHFFLKLKKPLKKHEFHFLQA